MARALARNFVLQQKPVADAQLGTFLPGEQFRILGHFDDGVFGRVLRLAVEEVGDGRDSVELELLVGVELQFHG